MKNYVRLTWQGNKRIYISSKTYLFIFHYLLHKTYFLLLANLNTISKWHLPCYFPYLDIMYILHLVVYFPFMSDNLGNIMTSRIFQKILPVTVSYLMLWEITISIWSDLSQNKSSWCNYSVLKHINNSTYRYVKPLLL